MLSRLIKSEIEKSFNEIQINLENNYKDLAIGARKQTEEMLSRLHNSGELADKYFEKYSEKLSVYTKRMENYHH